MGKHKKSLLQKQRPKKNWQKKAKQKIYFSFYFFLATIIIALAIFGYNQLLPKTKIFLSDHFALKNRSDIHLLINNISNNNVLLEKKIKQYLVEQIKKNKNIDLNLIAKSTQKKFGLRRVNLYKTTYKELRITIEERVPIMIIEAEQNCLLSADIDVYACVQKKFEDDLPRLKNIFLEPKKWQEIEDVVVLTNAERDLIIEALKIKKEADNQNYEILSLEYEYPRGFKAQLKNQTFSLFVGIYNYDKKFNRLSKLLTSQKKSLHDAEQIELDYLDKAIIQKKL